MCAECSLQVGAVAERLAVRVGLPQEWLVHPIAPLRTEDLYTNQEDPLLEVSLMLLGGHQIFSQELCQMFPGEHQMIPEG
jgi:hypothetical protein